MTNIKYRFSLTEMLVCILLLGGAALATSLWAVNSLERLRVERDAYRAKYLLTLGLSNQTQRINDELFEATRAIEAEVRALRMELRQQRAKRAIQQANPKAPAALIASLLVEAVERYNVPLDVALAVMWQESHFKVLAKGLGGERGLMQLSRGTAVALGVQWEMAYDPAVNIDAGVRYLARHLETYKAVNPALRRYNGGGDPFYISHVTKRLQVLRAGWGS